MSDRGERRAQRERLKRRRAGYYGGVHANNPARLSQLVDTPTPCSCFMCGNPRRKVGELTVQERRALEAAREAVLEAI